MIGWRRLELQETLQISEDLEADDGTAQFGITDRFSTRTHFNGFNFGLLYHRQRGCYTLDLLARFGIGTNRQSVSISGSTLLTTDSSQTFDSGIFALPSNIGTYERNRFAVVPEIGVTGGYYWTPNLRFTLGYTFLYWNNVVRPGDQVDLDIDPNLFPPTTATPTASSRPRFRFNEIDYWVQGWSIGAEYRF
ncbi:MAG: BBP7 family outer membrane beta-barrel protein [Pirellulaceae bacterium]